MDANARRTPSPTDRSLRGPRFTAPRRDPDANGSRTPSPTDGLSGATFTARRSPSPPPSRPRSRSLPVSMGGGRLRTVRQDDAASGSGIVAVPDAGSGSGDVAMTEVTPSSSCDISCPSAVPSSSTYSMDVSMADPPISSARSTMVNLALARHRYSIVQRLPFDVLSEVLRRWYEVELSESAWKARRVPFAALRVCGSWRQAAQATHRLWTHSWFSFRAMLGRPAWLAYHSCFVRFAGSLGFNLQIYCDMASSPAGDQVWEAIRATILPRARTIDMEIEELTSFTNVLGGLSLPALTTLRATSSYYMAPQVYPYLNLTMRAPQLRSLSFQRTFMEFDDVMDAATNPLWTTTTLDLERSQYTLGELRATASVCPQLVEFSLTVDSLWDAEDDPFVWARLEVLRVSVETIYSDSIPLRIQLPALRSLEVRDVKHNWDFWRQFVEAACPALEQLCVVRNHMDQGRQFVDGMGGLSQIRRLILRDGSLNEHLIGLLLVPRPGGIAFPNLRAIRFENTVAKPGFRFTSLKAFLGFRYEHLARNLIGGAFDFHCAFKRRIRDDERATNAWQMQLEQEISDWNAEARRTYLGF